MKEARLKISVIIPCYNEQEVINDVYDRVKNVLDQIDCREYEIIFINDGSNDVTGELIKSISEKDNRAKGISFSRNFGHEAATSAGIENCTGDIAFIIDADLQDPPELFPAMIAKYRKEGANVIYGARDNREGEGFFKKLTSKAFYRFLNLLSERKIPVDTGDFRLIDKKVINAYKAFPEKNKYVRGIISWMGFKQIPFFYVRDARQAGKTKYNFRKLLRFALDIIFYFSKTPLKLAISLGFLSILVGLGLTVYTFIGHYLRPTHGWASTLIIIIFFGGIQLLTIGIIGEYVGSIFDEVKSRPQYIIDEKYNLK